MSGFLGKSRQDFPRIRTSTSPGVSAGFRPMRAVKELLLQKPQTRAAHQMPQAAKQFDVCSSILVSQVGMESLVTVKRALVL